MEGAPLKPNLSSVKDGLVFLKGKRNIQMTFYLDLAAMIFGMPANSKDKALIKECAVVAVQSALAGISGLVGQDEDQENVIRACEFDRVAGAKPFNTEQAWFNDLLSEIAQPKGTSTSH